MEYKIIKGTVAFIESEVNKLIKQGWKIQGGVTSDVRGDLYQAMINSEKRQPSYQNRDTYKAKNTKHKDAKTVIVNK